MKLSRCLHSMCKLRDSVKMGKGGGLTRYRGALYRSYRALDEGGYFLCNVALLRGAIIIINKHITPAEVGWVWLHSCAIDHIVEVGGV